ncbi:hypothetical protein [Bacillus sp. 1P06AnD]|uniref:hypothetical protein n=1 Tax=Bacillus sp. 1P06AnD TaxID=3132208 RepID=UPI0039A38809
MSKGTIQQLGFNGPLPYCIIVWSRDGQNLSKTICYSPADKELALGRFSDQQDYYSTYDTAYVIDQQDKITVHKNKFITC